MLRDLSTVLEELHLGLQDLARGRGDGMPGVRLTRADMTLPVDTRVVLKDGGCALLADVARSHMDAAWLGSPSRLSLTWAEMPTEALP